MIKLVDRIYDVYKPTDTAAIKIFCNYAAYGNYPQIALFWQQTDREGNITALFSMIDGAMCISVNNGDLNEIQEFVSAVNPNSIFTSYNTAENLKLNITTVCTDMVKKDKTVASNIGPNASGNLFWLYDVLSDNFDLGDRDCVIADISHRIRHNCCGYVTTNCSGALLYYTDKYALINGIAVIKEKRRTGIGTSALNRLTEIAGDRPVYVCASASAVNFYLKNEFKIIGKSAYCLQQGG